MPYISRAEAAAFLAELGFPVAKNTLQKYASVGGGPPYSKFGNRCLYEHSKLLKWAESKVTHHECPHASRSGSMRKKVGGVLPQT